MSHLQILTGAPKTSLDKTNSGQLSLSPLGDFFLIRYIQVGREEISKILIDEFSKLAKSHLAKAKFICAALERESELASKFSWT